MRCVLALIALSACGRFGFSDTRDSGTGGAPPDELGLSLDATILGDGVAADACGTVRVLDDDFDIPGPAPEFMTYTTMGLTLEEVTSRLQVAFAASVPNGRYAGYKSTQMFATEGMCAYTRIRQVPVSNGLQYFKLTAGIEQIEYTAYQGMLHVRTHLDRQVATLVSIPYGDGTSEYLRIRQQGGVTYWDISSDGTSYDMLASTTFVTEPALYFELGAGAFGNADNAGAAQFEDAIVTIP